MRYLTLSLILFLFLGIGLFYSCQKEEIPDYRALVDAGEYEKAEEMIRLILKNRQDLSEQDRFDLSFEIERMNRIRKDFSKTEQDVLTFIQTYIPDVSTDDLDRWENEKSLEYKMIDGQKMYFNRAARNLFRLDEECRQIWREYYSKEEPKGQEEQFNILNYAEQVIRQAGEHGKSFVKPVRMRINFKLTVKANVVPQGETIRCWIPYPREIEMRQTDIQLINSFPIEHQVAPNQTLQRTI